MEWYWVIPISLFVIGFYGVFIVGGLSDVNIKISMVTDNNTMEFMNRTLSYQETLGYCYEFNTMTIRYIDYKENIITSSQTYVQNKTKIACDKYA